MVSLCLFNNVIKRLCQLLPPLAYRIRVHPKNSLFLNRMRKGKACIRPEDDGDQPIERPLGLIGRSVPSEMLHRPLIRPLTLEPQQEMVSRPSPVESKQEAITGKPTVTIPPPPAKHVEREKFFQEHKPDGSTAFNGHMRNLSLHSRNASSSRSGSMDFSD